MLVLAGLLQGCHVDPDTAVFLADVGTGVCADEFTAGGYGSSAMRAALARLLQIEHEGVAYAGTAAAATATPQE